MEILEINNLVSTLLSSMVLTAIAIISLKLGLITNLQSTIIGCLMILTPGVAITNSLRDIMGSDHIFRNGTNVRGFINSHFYCNWGWNNVMVLGG